MRRADRLFQIIQILRRSPRPVTALAMAAELEVSRRTVYRDIADLVAQRVPIDGEAGFGYVLDRSYDMPPLMLTPDEVEAVVLGAQWVTAHADSALANAARDLIAKIEVSIPDHLQPFLAHPAVAPQPPLRLSPDDKLAISLRNSVRDGRKIRLVYGAEDGKTTDRVVWPVTLGYSETHRLLIAWCELRQAFRHFRCDRILSAEIVDVPIGLPTGELRRRWQAWRREELAVLRHGPAERAND